MPDNTSSADIDAFMVAANKAAARATLDLGTAALSNSGDFDAAGSAAAAEAASQPVSAKLTAGAALAGAIVGTSDTQTLTNKRVNARVQSVADAATITPSADNDDAVDITAIAQAFTVANPTGTPVNFQRILIRIKDNGTARAISWGTDYVSGGATLPTTTVLSKILTIGFLYNTANALNKFQCVSVAQEI